MRMRHLADLGPYSYEFSFYSYALSISRGVFQFEKEIREIIMAPRFLLALRLPVLNLRPQSASFQVGKKRTVSKSN